MADYDGAGPGAVTQNKSLNLSPAWSPDARSLAFTSFSRGYPDLYRIFPVRAPARASAVGLRGHQ